MHVPMRQLIAASTVVLELLTQWLNPLREFSAPSFTPQSESAAPLLALLYRYVLRTAVLRTVLPVPYSTVVRYSTVLAHSGSQ